MKKVSILLALVLVIGVIHSCGGGGGSSSVTSTSMTRVTLNIGGAPAASSIGSTLRTISSIPASVYAITITITGPEMETIVREIVVAGRESFSEIFDVPNGPARHFLIEAKDAAGNVLYRGVADADMNGNPVTLDIAMLFVGQPTPTPTPTFTPTPTPGQSPTPTPTPTPTPSDTIPPTFGGVYEVVEKSSTEIRVIWPFPASDNVTLPANMVYLVYMATTSGGENLAVPNFVTPKGASSLLVTGLKEHTYYCFMVRAKDEAGNIDTNTVERCTWTQLPPTPTPSPTPIPTPTPTPTPTPMPELYPSNVVFVSPIPAPPASPQLQSIRVNNSGTMAVGIFDVCVYYPGDGYEYPGFYSIPVASLGAGTFTVLDLTSYAIYTSDYVIGVDYGSLIPESNESNNIVFGGYYASNPISPSQFVACCSNIDCSWPNVMDISPWFGGTLDLTPPVIVSATFSEDMTPTTINSSAFTVDCGGGSGTVAYNSSTRTATFTFSALPPTCSPCTGTITTMAKDLVGNPIGVSDFIWNFNTICP